MFVRSFEGQRDVSVENVSNALQGAALVSISCRSHPAQTRWDLHESHGGLLKTWIRQPGVPHPVEYIPRPTLPSRPSAKDAAKSFGAEVVRSFISGLLRWVPKRWRRS